MSLDSHERAPDAAGIERRNSRIDKSVSTLGSEDDILLSEIGKILSTDVYVPSLEATCHLGIEKRIYRSTAVFIKEVAVCILEILHEVIHPA